MEENKMTAPESGAAHMDAAYVIEKIEQIMAESENLKQSLELIASEHMDRFGHSAMAIGNMIEAREETNREMISLLKQIVDKL